MSHDGQHMTGSIDVADTAILEPYFTLEEPRLVLDVRPDSAFLQAHLVNSYHISPITELKSRYSYLPPRNVPFLVVADHDQQKDVVEAFSSVPSARLIFLSNSEASTSTQQTPEDGSPVHVCASRNFFDTARRLALVRSSQSHQQRVTATPAETSTHNSNNDIPNLLFRPSSAVRRTVLQLEASHQARKSLRMLDLGCGAARDLAWILHGSRARPSSPSWTGVGIDNWKAVLTRAQLLMDDLYLSSDAATPCCEQLLWAKCSEAGFLELLTGTGKGKSLQPEDDTQLWEEYVKLGLQPLLPTTEAQGVPGEEYAQFDLILSIRFHPRALFPRLSPLVRAGGIVLLSHFVTLSDAELLTAIKANPTGIVDYDSPPHDGRIQLGEVEGLVETWNGSVEQGLRWVIENEVLEPIEDGRIIKSVALRKAPV